MSSKKCLGCGARLSLDEKEVGYTKSLEMDFCQACFRLKHYRQVKTHHHPIQIPKLNENSLIIVVTSVLYLDLVFTYPIKRYQKNSKVVYLINQLDLLPYQTNYQYLYQRLREEANLYHAEYEDIILMSSTDQDDIEKLRTYLKTYQVKDIYLFGVQNSGKTTLFNALTGRKEPLTDVKAGLTQDTITAQFEHFKLHDMPGLYQNGYIHEFLPYEDYRKLIPLREFKPIIYQVKVNQAFIINEMLAIKLLKGDNNSVVFYFNNPKINRINEANINKQLNQLFEYTKTTFKLSKAQKYQITVADIGLIHLEGLQTVELTYPKGLHISLKEAFFL